MRDGLAHCDGALAHCVFLLVQCASRRVSTKRASETRMALYPWPLLNHRLYWSSILMLPRCSRIFALLLLALLGATCSPTGSVESPPASRPSAPPGPAGVRPGTIELHR